MSEKHPHSALIDAVGPKVVVLHFSPHFKLSAQRLHAWRKRGIPYAFRAEFAKLASVHGHAVPADFFAAPGMAA